MRRMYSENQLIKEIQENSMSQEDVEEMVVGKYVKIIPAPESTTLSDDQINDIIKGTFLNANFLNLINPVFFPARSVSGDAFYQGIVIAYQSAGSPIIGMYQINRTSKVIQIMSASTKVINLNSIESFNGKSVPAYPSSTGVFVLKCDNGTLKWVEEA